MYWKAICIDIRFHWNHHPPSDHYTRALSPLLWQALTSPFLKFLVCGGGGGGGRQVQSLKMGNCMFKLVPSVKVLFTSKRFPCYLIKLSITKTINGVLFLTVKVFCLQVRNSRTIPKGHRIALQSITRIGSALSMTGLVITILTVLFMYVIKGCWKRTRSTHPPKKESGGEREEAHMPSAVLVQGLPQWWHHDSRRCPCMQAPVQIHVGPCKTVKPISCHNTELWPLQHATLHWHWLLQSFRWGLWNRSPLSNRRSSSEDVRVILCRPVCKNKISIKKSFFNLNVEVFLFKKKKHIQNWESHGHWGHQSTSPSVNEHG